MKRSMLILGFLALCGVFWGCNQHPADEEESPCPDGLCGLVVGDVVVVRAIAPDGQDYITVRTEVVERLPARLPERLLPRWRMHTTVTTVLGGEREYESWVGVATTRDGVPLPDGVLETVDWDLVSPQYTLLEPDLSGMQLLVPGPAENASIELRIPPPSRVDMDNPRTRQVEIIYPADGAYYSNLNQIHFGIEPEDLEVSEDGLWRRFGPLPNIHLEGFVAAPVEVTLSMERL